MINILFLKLLLDRIWNTIFLFFPFIKNLKNLIEKVQRRFTKRICPQGLHYSQRLDMLSDMSIERRHSIYTLLCMYKIIVCDLS